MHIKSTHFLARFSSFGIFALACVGPAQAQIYQVSDFALVANSRWPSIPKIIKTNNGTLLVAREDRIGSNADSTNADIVIRRSTDNGVTWSADTVLVSNVGGLVSLGYNHSTNTVLVAHSTGAVISALRSTDQGVSWTASTFTRTANPSGQNVIAHGSGPAFAIRNGASQGKWIMPGKIIVGPQSYSSFMVSTDNGYNWASRPAIITDGNEAEIIETSGDGTLYMNVRRWVNNAPNNKRAYSRLIGAAGSWTAPVVLPQGVGTFNNSVCNDGNGGGDVIFIRQGANNVNLAADRSTDNGLSFVQGKRLYTGNNVWYSTCAKADDGAYVAVFEINSRNGLKVVRFDKTWLLAP